MHVPPGTPSHSTPSRGTRATKTYGEPSSGRTATSSATQQPTATGSGHSSDSAASPPNPASASPSPSKPSSLSRPGGSTPRGEVVSPTFRPPQSQGIPIAVARRAFNRRTSWRTNSFGGSSVGGAYASPFSGVGSFLRSAAILGNQHSSFNSWSIWNSGSFDSRFGRDLGGDIPAPTPHSLRSWVWVNDRGESELSGEPMCSVVMLNKLSCL